MTGIVAVQRPTSVPSHTRSCMMSRQNEMVPALRQQPGTVDNTCERGAVMADRTCSFLGCSRPARARGWCTLHYQRWQRHGSPEVVLPTGPRPNRRAVNYHGYIRLKEPTHPLADPTGWVLEHRMVAWDAFGPFDPTCHVHHRNGDKVDNRAENLEVLTQEQHAREHADERRRIDPAEAERLYRLGLTQAEVAAALGTHGGWVSRVLRKRGVRVISRAERAALHDDITNATGDLLEMARELDLRRKPKT